MVWRCPSVRPSVRLLTRKNIDANGGFFFEFGTQVCLGVPSINLLFVSSYLIRYVHKSLISDFSIFGIHRVIFSCDQAAVRPSVRLSVRLCTIG